MAKEKVETCECKKCGYFWVLDPKKIQMINCPHCYKSYAYIQCESCHQLVKVTKKEEEVAV